jgi:hypothetical protein
MEADDQSPKVGKYMKDKVLKGNGEKPTNINETTQTEWFKVTSEDLVKKLDDIHTLILEDKKHGYGQSAQTVIGATQTVSTRQKALDLVAKLLRLDTT